MRLRLFLLYAIDALFVLITMTLPLLWLIGRFRLEAGGLRLSVSWGIRPFLALTALLLARLCLASIRATPPLPGLLSRRRLKQVLLAFGVLIALLPLVDVLLALKGLTRHPQSIVIADAHDWEGQKQYFLHDPKLLWKFKPGATIPGKTINQLGFPEREIVAQKTADVTRVICMGDSCTAEGIPPYSTLLHQLLTNAPPHRKQWEAFHTGVHGYSVVQGLALFKQTTRQLHPDIVTIYFGWNGHWLAQHSDTRRIASRDVATPGALLNRLLRPDITEAGHPTDKVLRVPPGAYELTLGTLVREVRNSGAVPILITAPRATRLSCVLAERQETPLEHLHDLHDQYVAITRTVAEKEQCELVDAAQQFAAMANRDDLFLCDGIHMKDAGLELMANLIYARIMALE